MFRYNCEDDGPRPESYLEDYELAQHCKTSEEKTIMYYEMKTGAETGWDYSSRWFIDSKMTNNGTLKDTKARSIVPVDLNSIMAKNAEILGQFYDLIGDSTKSQLFHNANQQLVQSIENVLWNEEQGVWLDFDLTSGKSRDYFCPSNVWPLWTESYDHSRKNMFTSRAMEYLKKQGLEDYEGGVPTTFSQTGQQWDFPNCWPPLEHMMVKGLENCDLVEAKDLAYELAAKRVKSCYLNYVAKGHMFEKYDATSVTKIGGGGEYEIQLGFGWTNGVVMDFLNMYAGKLSSQE